MSVFRSDGDRVVPMPAVQRRFNFVAGYRRDECPWCFCVVCLSWCKLIQSRKVNHSPGLSVGFGSDKHTVAPRDGVVDRNFFQHSQLAVSVQASFDIFSPV